MLLNEVRANNGRFQREESWRFPTGSCVFRDSCYSLPRRALTVIASYHADDNNHHGRVFHSLSISKRCRNHIGIVACYYSVFPISETVRATLRASCVTRLEEKQEHSTETLGLETLGHEAFPFGLRLKP